MKRVRFGVVGGGIIGDLHCRNISQARSRDFCLSAVCDVCREKAEALGRKYGVPAFSDAQEMYDSGLCDAVLVASPHYWHAPLTIRAARAGLHVLCEKPLATAVGPARAMIAECKKHKVALGGMLQQRTRKTLIKMKQLVDRGAIGEVFRVSLIGSNWFRTQAYYDSGEWRGTWDGEGGGVLINQAPHHLDLFQWIGGMPRRVLGLVATRAHDIEVEDTANFLCDYGGGKVGYLYVTTAQLPGTEQFVLTGEKGVLIFEGGRLRLGRLPTSIKEYIHTSKEAWADAKHDLKLTWRDVTPKSDSGNGHLQVVKAFAGHLLRGSEMVAPGEEAIKELELSNAMYLAGFGNKPVELPVDAAAVDRLLARLERERSTGKGGGLRKRAQREMRKLLSETRLRRKARRTDRPGR